MSIWLVLRTSESLAPPAFSFSAAAAGDGSLEEGARSSAAMMDVWMDWYDVSFVSIVHTIDVLASCFIIFAYAKR